MCKKKNSCIWESTCDVNKHDGTQRAIQLLIHDFVRQHESIHLQPAAEVTYRPFKFSSMQMIVNRSIFIVLRPAYVSCFLSSAATHTSSQAARTHTLIRNNQTHKQATRLLVLFFISSIHAVPEVPAGCCSANPTVRSGGLFILVSTFRVFAWEAAAPFDWFLHCKSLCMQTGGPADQRWPRTSRLTGSKPSSSPWRCALTDHTCNLRGKRNPNTASATRHMRTKPERWKIEKFRSGSEDLKERQTSRVQLLLWKQSVIVHQESSRQNITEEHDFGFPNRVVRPIW